MRISAICLALVGPLGVQAEEVAFVDTRSLTVAEHIALVAEARRDATRIDCCDWGGGGCDPALVRKLLGLPPSKLAVRIGIEATVSATSH